MPTTERLVRVALALALACGVVLTDSAAGRAAGAPAAAKHLELTPAAAVAQVGEPIRYVAEAVDDNGDREDLTPLTAFRFSDPAVCRQSQDPATRGEVTCLKPGQYKIAGDVDVPPLTSAPVDLEVVEEAVSPRIESVDRSPTPPNRDLTVTGSTGTCEHTGTLSLVGTNSSKAVAGKFTTTLPVPPGIVPRDYKLLLTVLCNGDRQEDRFKLVVENQPPTPGNDEASTVPGKPVTIPVAGNDTDPDDPDGYGTRLEEASPGPSHGTVAVQGDQIVYSPDGTFDSRGDSFTYASCDVIGRRAIACGSATVTVARKPPTPHNDEARTEQGKAVSIPVTGNDDDPDDTLLHVSRDPKEPGATAVVDRNHPGRIEYTPAGTFIGDDTFEYDYCPIVINAAAPSTCKSATVTVHVERRQVPPRIDSVADDPTPPNREVTVTGTTGTCDPAATLTLNSRPKAASVAVTGGQDGAFEAKLKVPPGTFVDSYQLTLRAACDGSPVAVERELKVVNQRPDAVEDRVTIDSTAGARVAIKVLDNDTDPDDPDGYATRLTIERDPAHGTAQVRSDQTMIDYTPDEGFKDVGEDRFTYAYCDVVGPRGATDCDTATVTVTKLPPEAVDDPGITTVKDDAVVIRIMRNDRNAGKVDIPKLRVRPDPKPKGEPRLLADGTIEYHPQPGATGTDSFQYDYCGGPNVNTAAQRCQPATVTVTVKPRPIPPGIDSVAPNPTPPNHEVTVTGTTGTCEPAATLTLDSRPKATTPVAVTGGQDGAFEAKLKVPPGTFVGPYRLRLRVVCDGKTEVVERELRVANQPPTPVDDQAPTTEGNPVTIDVTANDTDPDGDDGYDTSLKPAQPARGRVDQEPGKPLVYTPEDGFIGVDRFTYRLCEIVDAAGAEDCGTATVTVTVGPRKPVPVDDPDVTTVRDQAVVVDVMRNDRDPDPARLQARQPARPGAKVEQQADGTVRYIPEAGFTGVDTFQYDYCAGSGGATAAQGACPFATVTVTVNPPDPVPVDDPDKTTLRDRPAVLDVMDNDRDPDPARLRVLERPAPEGAAVVQPDGSIRYTPAAGAVGDDRFRYDYCGGSVGVTAAQGPCPSATVTVAVTAVPVISSVEPAATPPGKPVEVVGNTGSCNPSGTLELRGAGATATATADPDGAFTTTLTVPAGTFPRPYRLELRVDCGGQTQRAEAPLTVTNQAPVPAEDLESTTRDQAVRIDVTKNDRDPDDPDGYPTLVLVTRGPDHGSAQEQGESVLYTPAPGFVGTDQFDYSLCDDVLNAANKADCGTATVTITVTDVPAISSVEPGSTSPGRPVQVAGSTGSCGHAGTLIFSGATDRPIEVNGDRNGGFATTLTVPEGTFPNRYRLELVVDCNGRPQRAEAALTVANQAPVAVDDEVSIAPDADTTIDVTRNDHDPDDPDTYQTLVVVTDVPDHGSAQEQGLSVRYTPEPGFVGTDQFEYALCDDVVNATGEADCGRATVAVRAGPPPCAPTGTGDPGLRAEPSRGPGGTMLHITATVDRKLATCQFRLLLGGTTLAPDVTVGDDGSIAADRGVPGNATPGPNPMRLATLTALTVDETPFEVMPEPPPPPPPPNWPRRLALSAGALLAGFLARAAFRRWLKPDGERSKHRGVEPSDGLQARPHPRPGETSVAPVADGTHPSSLRLEPHFDPGVQTVDIVEEEEVTR